MNLLNSVKNRLRNTFIGEIGRTYKLNKFRRFWNKKNSHNNTIPQNVFDSSIVLIGKYTYGKLFIVSSNNKHYLKIGNYVSIAQNVTFVLNSEHYTNHISTFPFKVMCLEDKSPEAFGKGNIIVEDDVWIGYGATIMSGVHIGQGAVVAAGAVVTKDVPAYAVVGGVPAKVIKYRFSEPLIEEILKVDYSKLTKEMIAEHENDLYTELTDAKQLDWMPKKQ